MFTIKIEFCLTVMIDKNYFVGRCRWYKLKMPFLYLYALRENKYYNKIQGIVTLTTQLIQSILQTSPSIVFTYCLSTPNIYLSRSIDCLLFLEYTNRAHFAERAAKTAKQARRHTSHLQSNHRAR